MLTSDPTVCIKTHRHWESITEQTEWLWRMRRRGFVVLLRMHCSSPLSAQPVSQQTSLLMGQCEALNSCTALSGGGWMFLYSSLNTTQITLTITNPFRTSQKGVIYTIAMWICQRFVQKDHARCSAVENTVANDDNKLPGGCNAVRCCIELISICACGTSLI